MHIWVERTRWMENQTQIFKWKTHIYRWYHPSETRNNKYKHKYKFRLMDLNHTWSHSRMSMIRIFTYEYDTNGKYGSNYDCKCERNSYICKYPSGNNWGLWRFFFFQIWRPWILNNLIYNLKSNFINWEIFLDVKIYCHFVVLLIKMFCDFYPQLEVHCISQGSMELR